MKCQLTYFSSKSGVFQFNLVLLAELWCPPATSLPLQGKHSPASLPWSEHSSRAQGQGDKVCLCLCPAQSWAVTADTLQLTSLKKKDKNCLGLPDFKYFGSTVLGFLPSPARLSLQQKQECQICVGINPSTWPWRRVPKALIPWKGRGQPGGCQQQS